MSLREHYRNFPWSYYRDKMLALVTTLASIFLIIRLWDWPWTMAHLRQASPYVIIIAMSVAVAKRKLFLMIAAVGFISTRLVIGSFLHGGLAVAALALLSIGILAVLIRASAPYYTWADFPQEYTRAELLLDVTLGPIVLAIMIVIARVLN